MLKKVGKAVGGRGEIRDEVAALRNEVATLRQLLETTDALLRVEANEREQRLLRTILRQRAAVVAPRPTDAAKDITPRATAPTFDEACALLEQAAPHAYQLWRELLDVNAHTYTGFPVHSCSVDGHAMAELFGCFLKPYLTGTVLDVGCGPQPMPSYLEGHAPELIAGVDPLEPPSAHPFVFARGVCEHLPWPDGTFDLVVIATSLDHVLLLDRALTEVERVLATGGHLAVWVSFVAGAERYDPYAARVEKVDDYHLFHFDRPWFEEVLGERFTVAEAISFGQGNPSSFFAFRPRS